MRTVPSGPITFHGEAARTLACSRVSLQISPWAGTGKKNFRSSTISAQIPP